MIMKSYKDYSSENNEQIPKQTVNVKTGATAEELTKKIAAAYHGRSNADMFRQIIAQAEEGKRNGTLTNEEIDNFYAAFSPMLDSTQSKRLRAIVNKLKEI